MEPAHDRTELLEELGRRVLDSRRRTSDASKDSKDPTIERWHVVDEREELRPRNALPRASSSPVAAQRNFSTSEVGSPTFTTTRPIAESANQLSLPQPCWIRSIAVTGAADGSARDERFAHRVGVDQLT